MFVSNQFEPNPVLPGGTIALNATGVNNAVFAPDDSSVIVDARGNLDIAGNISASSDIGNAGDIVLLSQDAIVLNEASLFSEADDTVGNGGDIRIAAASFLAENGSTVQTSSQAGNGGDVIINVSDRAVFSGRSADGQFSSGIFTRVSEGAVGNAGNIFITARSIEVTDDATLTTSTLGTGNGGDIIINTTTLEMLSEAQLSASTQGEGDAGNVLINASDRVTFDDGNVFSSVGTDAVGAGGDITLNTTTLEMLNGAAFIASTRGKGDAGNVLINASDRVVFSGRSADDQFSSGIFTRVNEGAVGNAGNISITARSLEVVDDATLITSTSGEGNAGNISITASESVLFDGDRSIASARVDEDAVGNAGDISIVTNTLELLDGAVLSTTTEGEGNAGNVTVIANDRIRMDGNNTVRADNGAGIFTGIAGGTGTGGNITIETRTLEMFNAARLQSANGTVLIPPEEEGEGDAGNIFIRVRKKLSLGAVRQTVSLKMERNEKLYLEVVPVLA